MTRDFGLLSNVGAIVRLEMETVPYEEAVSPVPIRLERSSPTEIVLWGKYYWREQICTDNWKK